MKILALEREVPGTPKNQFTEELLEEEARVVLQLHQSGDIRELYFRADRREAVLVLESATVETAKAMLTTLPLVRQGLIEFEVIPLVAYTGFSRLFKE